MPFLQTWGCLGWHNCADISWVSSWYRGLLGSMKHFILWSVLQWMSETLILLESSAIFWYFLQKKIYKKDFIFLNILCDKCLFLSSYWGCLTFSEIPNIALATVSVRPNVFTLYYLLGWVMFKWFSLRKSEHSEYCRYAVAWVHLHTFFILCPWWLTDRREMAWWHQNALTSVWRSGEQTRAMDRRSPRETSCCDVPVRRVSQNTWRFTEGLRTCKMLWIEACCNSCAMPLDVLVDFVFKLLTGAPFSTKKRLIIADSWAWT